MNNAISATIVKDSTTEAGKRITTFELCYPRFIHGEVMTHRVFCISGDAELEFDLPGGQRGSKRVHRMSLREFAHKWHTGAVQHPTARHNGKFLELDNDTVYTSKTIATMLEVTQSNLNALCCKGFVNAQKNSEGVWEAAGSEWNAWRNKTGKRTYSLQSRLKKMQIRQLNETTNGVQTANVLDCIISGTKPVFRVVAGDYSTVATADHRVYTNNGWKRIGDLVVGEDKLCTYKYGAKASPDKFKKIDGVWVSKWNREVRNEIAERQSQLCAMSGLPLEVDFHIHHVKPRYSHPELAFDKTNVIAVNADEHQKLHSKQGWQIGVALNSEFTTVESITAEGEIDTYDLSISGEFANFFADGIVVHNSRNAMSSRAIPVKKVLAQVWSDPAMPVHWGANQAGMQAKSQLKGWRKALARGLWRGAGKVACVFAWGLMKLGLHKQVANRILEPWQWMRTLVTATEWDNFYELRNHEDAQPEFRALAIRMRTEMDISVPQVLKVGEWHLPYVESKQPGKELLNCKLSAARCARVSYLTHDGKNPDEVKDLALFERLAGSRPIHASPTEHQASPGDVSWGNFVGWTQYRKLWEMKV